MWSVHIHYILLLLNSPGYFLTFIYMYTYIYIYMCMVYIYIYHKNTKRKQCASVQETTTRPEHRAKTAAKTFCVT